MYWCLFYLRNQKNRVILNVKESIIRYIAISHILFKIVAIENHTAESYNQQNNIRNYLINQINTGTDS